MVETVFCSNNNLPQISIKNYGLLQGGQVMCESITLDFTSKIVETREVSRHESTGKRWEGINNFTMYKAW